MYVVRSSRSPALGRVVLNRRNTLLFLLWCEWRLNKLSRFRVEIEFSHCRDIEYFATVQPLSSRIVHADLNQRTNTMLIDEAKMVVDSSESFELQKSRKQHTNLKSRTFYLRLKRKQNFAEQNRSTRTYRDWPMRIEHFDCASQSQIPNLG